jgi:hypothetical protein
VYSLYIINDALVDRSFLSPLGSFSVAFVFVNVWDLAVIEADFSRLFSVESLVDIEESTSSSWQLMPLTSRMQRV